MMIGTNDIDVDHQLNVKDGSDYMLLLSTPSTSSIVLADCRRGCTV